MEESSRSLVAPRKGAIKSSSGLSWGDSLVRDEISFTIEDALADKSAAPFCNIDLQIKPNLYLWFHYNDPRLHLHAALIPREALRHAGVSLSTLP